MQINERFSIDAILCFKSANREHQSTTHILKDSIYNTLQLRIARDFFFSKFQFQYLKSSVINFQNRVYIISNNLKGIAG